MEISVRSNFKEIEKNLNRFVRQQLPFAEARAITAIAQRVADAEIENLSRVLDRPTPFTQRSIGVKAARKGLPEATVFVKDIAAEYLSPYEFGGLNKLNSKALLKPVNLATNIYGNLNRRQIAQLRGRPDIFIGSVRSRNGDSIDGVWQRPSAGRAGSKGRISKSSNTTGRLKLLIRFSDAHQVTQHLGWRELARKVVARSFKEEFGKALAYALATSR